MNKFKTTSVSTDVECLTVVIDVFSDGQVCETHSMVFPFRLVPPQIAHQIASNLVMANSYYVEEKVSDSVESK